MSSGEKTWWERKKELSESDARARQELAAIVEDRISYMTQREAAENVGATILLLQRWRLGDPIALEVMQALARKGTQVTHTGGEKLSHTAKRNLQRKAQKQLARWMRVVPSIVESMEEEWRAQHAQGQDQRHGQGSWPAAQGVCVGVGGADAGATAALRFQPAKQLGAGGFPLWQPWQWQQQQQHYHQCGSRSTRRWDRRRQPHLSAATRSSPMEQYLHHLQQVQQYRYHLQQYQQYQHHHQQQQPLVSLGCQHELSTRALARHDESVRSGRVLPDVNDDAASQTSSWAPSDASYFTTRWLPHDLV